MEQRVIISTQLESELVSALSECEHDKLFVLTDTTTLELCMPVLQNFYCMKEAHIITIPATDSHKDIESLMMVWKGLQEGGASRHSCMINLGGGMVTDLGGFAASTFKRGINFINIPTTLLAMVDASVGGKTGINFGGLKNEVGVFNDSKFVILDTEFLKTLDAENICSGYAEMLKHGLISTEAMWEELVSFDLDKPDLKQLQRMVGDSVNAQLWVSKKQCKTKLERTPQTEQLYQVIARAENWLRTHPINIPIIKWETKKWGEIPADFGRKG